MTTVRIWSLEPFYDAEAINRLADKLVTPLQLGNLSIQPASEKRFLKPKNDGEHLNGKLRKALLHYLKQDAHVIIFTNRDSPTSIHQRWGKTDSLINQIEQVANDTRFADKVSFTKTLHELEACLPTVCKSLEIDSRTCQEKWESTLAHFHEAFADIPKDELIKDFEEALVAVRRERALIPQENIVSLTAPFEVVSPNAIRIRGTRVGIEFVIEKYREGATPREIQAHYPHLTLKQIYATITYYMFHKAKVDAYIKAGIERVEAAYEEQRKNPSPGIKRLMKIKAQREAAQLQVREETQ